MPVLKYMKQCWLRGDTDISLIRYFVNEVRKFIFRKNLQLSHKKMMMRAFYFNRILSTTTQLNSFDNSLTTNLCLCVCA